ASIKSDVATIKGDLNTLTNRISSVELRVNNLESGAVDRNERLDKLEEYMEYQAKYASELWDRIQDLENRSRRNNIRVIRVPEGTENNFSSNTVFLMGLLRDCLQLGPEISFEIERAHRSLGPKPSEGQRPRPIIACFLRFTDKSRVLNSAREMGSLSWQGEKIMVFPDMLPELAAQRHGSTPVRHKCKMLGLRYAMQYPAIFRITVAGQPRQFTDPEEALTFLQELPQAKEGRREIPAPRREEK
uniref:L1 transposable element RRM domain-containing protein n=1 Tax=Latimeria chalumnae TaxID=7897 RepID=H2ZUY0_LATCH